LQVASNFLKVIGKYLLILVVVRVLHYCITKVDAGGHSLPCPRETSSGIKKFQGV